MHIVALTTDVIIIATKKENIEINTYTIDGSRFQVHFSGRFFKVKIGQTVKLSR
jgi:hypothetical protein